MPRPPRSLAPRGLYHVFNRALARRTAFEREEDFRAFMCLMALAVRRYGIRIVAYCLMPTHIHLIVEAPEDPALVSDAMRFIESQYTRYFNRGRKRDGPLWRTRFSAKHVRDALYRIVLVRYVDANPVQARIVRLPGEYPYGSAYHYHRARCPKWIARDVIEQTMRDALGPLRHVTMDYDRLFLAGPHGFESALMAQHQRSSSRMLSTSLLDLVRSAPRAVQDWMQRKARLADGTAAGLAVAAPTALIQAAKSIQWRAEELPRLGRHQDRPRDIATAGLLRDAGALTVREVGERLTASESMVRRYLAEHRRRILGEPAYVSLVAQALHTALQCTFKSIPSSLLDRLALAQARDAS